MSEEFKNPFLEGSEEVPSDEVTAAAKELAEEAKKARLKVTAAPAPKQKAPVPASKQNALAPAVVPKAPAPAVASPPPPTPVPAAAQAAAPVAPRPKAADTPITPGLYPPTSIDSANGPKTISAPALVTDIIAASIAIVLTLLFLQDVLPFFN